MKKIMMVLGLLAICSTGFASEWNCFNYKKGRYETSVLVSAGEPDSMDFNGPNFLDQIVPTNEKVDIFFEKMPRFGRVCVKGNWVTIFQPLNNQNTMYAFDAM